MSMQAFHRRLPALQSLWQALLDGPVRHDGPPPVVEGSLGGLGNHRIDGTHIPSAWI